MVKFGEKGGVLVGTGEECQSELVKGVLDGIRVEGGMFVDDVTPVGIFQDVFRVLDHTGPGFVGVLGAGFSELPVEGHEGYLIILSGAVAEEAGMEVGGFRKWERKPVGAFVIRILGGVNTRVPKHT